MRRLLLAGVMAAVILLVAGHPEIGIPLGAIMGTPLFLDGVFHRRRRRRSLAWRIVRRALFGGRSHYHQMQRPAPFNPLGETRRREKIPPGVKQQVWRRDRGRCRKCGITNAESLGKTGERLQYDHIVPFSRNGASSAGNIQLLCGPCNRKKGAEMP